MKAPRERTARAERVKFLPLDGLKRLWAAPTGDGAQPRRDLAILALMGIHGLRVAEVASLQVGDVDLSRQTVTVTGKGGKTRMIYLTPATAAGLASWLEIRAAVALDAALFVALGNHERGGGMSDRAIRLIVDGYLGRLGLERAGVSCHSLRHSVATWARAGGAQLDALAGMLGHASVTTTQVYAKVVDRMAENPARYLEAVLGGATSA